MPPPPPGGEPAVDYEAPAAFAYGWRAFKAMIRGCLDICEGRPFSLEDAFSRISPVPIVITGVIVSLLTSIGFVLLMLPGIIFSIFSSFAIYFVVEVA